MTEQRRHAGLKVRNIARTRRVADQLVKKGGRPQGLLRHMAHVSNVGSNDFGEAVLESELPVLVDFWAPWCGPCRRMSPEIDAVAAEMDGRVKVAKLNTDLDPEIAERFEVRSIPTLMLFERGSEKGRLVGGYPRSEIISELVSTFPQLTQVSGT